MIGRLSGLVMTALLMATAMPAAAGADPAIKVETGRLGLTRTQERELYLQLVRQSTSEAAPPGFRARIGSAAPRSIKLRVLPAGAVKALPSIDRYNYALLYYFGMAGDVVLIVEPRSRTIVDVMGPMAGAW